MTTTTPFARNRRLLQSSFGFAAALLRRHGSFALSHHHYRGTCAYFSSRNTGGLQSSIPKENDKSDDTAKRSFSDASASFSEDAILLKRNLRLPQDDAEEQLDKTENKDNDNAPFYTILTLNQPTRFNPLSLDMLLRLEKELKIADRAFPQCRCVVINAAPGKAFCAGHDMKEIHRNLQQQQQQQVVKDEDGEEPSNDGNKDNNNNNNIKKLFDTCARVMESFRTIRPVTIAAVDGIATAAGCQLVAAVDLAIGTQSSRFALSGIHNGLVCSTPIVPVSRSIRHRKQALEMLLTGDFISADRALEYGLINQVVVAVVEEENGKISNDALQEATVDLVQRITRHSSHAVSRGKQLFYEQYDLDLHDAYALATHRIVDDVTNSKDASEGISAFVEKRKPKWET